MKQRHSAIPRSMCFIFYNDEILLLKAVLKKNWQGTYNIVGGHVEPHG